MAIVIMTGEQFPRMLVLIFTFLDHVLTREVIKDYKNYTLFELHGPKEDLLKMIKFINKVDESAPYEFGRKISHILVAPEFESRFWAALNKTHLKILELSRDYSKVIAAEKKLSLRSSKFSWNGYFGLNDIFKFLTTTQAKFRSWTKVVVGGESYEGRKILGLRISTNVTLSGNKPKPIVIIEAGIHAREWIVPAVATYFINQLLTSEHKNLMTLRDSFEWHIFPVVNPDGYHHSFTKPGDVHCCTKVSSKVTFPHCYAVTINIAQGQTLRIAGVDLSVSCFTYGQLYVAFFRDRLWRKTRSKTNKPYCFGVDANRNWDYNFGTYGTSDNPCHYQIYHGDVAFSEVETRSMAAYLLQIKHALAYISLHSYDWSVMLPHSDSFEHVMDYDRLLRVAKKMTDNSYIQTIFNRKRYYEVGTSAELGQKVTGASIDWVYRKMKTPLTFIIELRGYNFTWPEWRIVELGKEFTNMLIDLFEEAKQYDFY